MPVEKCPRSFNSSKIWLKYDKNLKKSMFPKDIGNCDNFATGGSGDGGG